jgi:hypothetical protein
MIVTQPSDLWHKNAIIAAIAQDSALARDT